MEFLWRDIRYATRILIKNRGFSAIAILTLALGIGVNTAIFSVINSLLIRPLAFKESDRLVTFWNRAPGLNISQDWMSAGEYVDIKTNCDAFNDVAIFSGRALTLTGVEPPERVQCLRVSASFFPLLGIQPAHGRVFLPEDDEAGKPLVAILSNELWQRKFGADPALVGKTVVLNGLPITVVGILPPDFSLSKEMISTVGSIERADLMLSLPISKRIWW